MGWSVMNGLVAAGVGAAAVKPRDACYTPGCKRIIRRIAAETRTRADPAVNANLADTIDTRPLIRSLLPAEVR
jgi:hypothetical protein